MQYFKGDVTEVKMDAVGEPIMSNLSLNKSTFFDDAFSCFVLGELLYDNARSPLANAIDRDIFRQLFATIFAAFVVGGTFESYLTVFRNIFGDDVTVTFTVSAAGKLTIAITATGVTQNNLLARTIVSGVYTFDEILDSNGNNLVARNPKGFQTQYEAEQMLFEMVPGGIYTTVSLTI